MDNRHHAEFTGSSPASSVLRSQLLTQQDAVDFHHGASPRVTRTEIPNMERVSRINEYELVDENAMTAMMRSSSSSNFMGSRQIGSKALVGNAQTILQETIQTETANVLNGGGVNTSSKSKKITSQFMEMKLNSMKKKHRDLQKQLSEVSNYETSGSRAKTLLHASKSVTNIAGGQSAGFFASTAASSNKLNDAAALNRMLETLSSVTQFVGKKEIEVRVEPNGLAVIVKNLMEQYTTLQAKYNESKSENVTVKLLLDATNAENSTLKDENQTLTEEIKNTKAFLADTRVELERMKTHFDILERRYIDLLKQKQEVKIINKETIREIVVERPIETIKYVVNQKIVKKNKEVRKIVRAKPDIKLTINEKLHVVNREVHVPTVITLEKIVEVPKREIVEIDRPIDRPVYVEKPVFIDRPVEAPVQVINRYIETPIRQEVETPIFHTIRVPDPMQEREKQHLLNVNSQLKRDNLMLSDENRFFRNSQIQHSQVSAVHPSNHSLTQVVHHHHPRGPSSPPPPLMHSPTAPHTIIHHQSPNIAASYVH